MNHSITLLATSIALCITMSAAAQNTSAMRMAYDAPSVAKAVAAKEPPGLRASAERGLMTLITELGKDLPAGNLPEGFPFDVHDFSELKNAKLGLGFEVHTAHPQTLLAGGRPFEQMLMGTGIWNFVVLVGDHPVALLEMEKIQGKWQVNGAGGSQLAQDVYLSTQQNAGKNAFRFVRIYQATADFLEVKDFEGKARFAPLKAARQSLRMSIKNEASSVTDSEILPSLQQAVREHLARFKP